MIDNKSLCRLSFATEAALVVILGRPRDREKALGPQLPGLPHLGQCSYPSHVVTGFLLLDISDSTPVDSQRQSSKNLASMLSILQACPLQFYFYTQPPDCLSLSFSLSSRGLLKPLMFMKVTSAFKNQTSA